MINEFENEVRTTLHWWFLLYRCWQTQ